MTKEELLARETNKEDGLDVAKRVFYTLDGKQGEPHRDAVRTHRNSKAIALLFKALHEKRHLSDDTLDEILLEVIN